MIKSISIQNFQSHESTKLELSPGVNVVVGLSDCGKSAILRAINWNVWNRPQGDDIRSTWGGDTCVALETSEGNTIERVKEPENVYRLNGDEFRAFRTEVPEEIAKMLNLSSVNFQYQFDKGSETELRNTSQFLLDASPGEVAQHFNRVAHLDQIDAGLKSVQSWIRGLEADIAHAETGLTELQESERRYAYLDALEKDVAVLEGLEIDQIRLTQYRMELSRLLNELASVDVQVNQFERLTRHDALVSGTLALFGDRRTLAERRQSLSLICDDVYQIADQIFQHEKMTKNEALVFDTLSLYNQRRTLQDEREGLTATVTQLGEIKRSLDCYGAITGVDKDVFQTLGLLQERKALETRRTELKSLLILLRTAELDILHYEREQVSMQKAFDTAMPNVCPLCGRSGE